MVLEEGVENGEMYVGVVIELHLLRTQLISRSTSIFWLSNIYNDFTSNFRFTSIKASNEHSRKHHEQTGNFFSTQLQSAQKLSIHLTREGNPYEYTDLQNLMTFSVPRASICTDVCQRDVLGAKALNKFRAERMLFDEDSEESNIRVPFWSTLSRNNFQMFSDINIVLSDKQKTLTTMKKEKQLYARLLFISKARPELCPEQVIGEYEFTSIPPSNFLPDGSMITTKSNDTLIKLIMNLPILDDEANSEFQPSSDDDSVAIVNAMEILETVKKNKPMQKVSDVLKYFLIELESQTKGCQEVRLIFKRYVLSPLNDFKTTETNV